MRMLLCTIGSKQHELTLRFGAQVARALARELTLLGITKDQRQASEMGKALHELVGDLTAHELPVEVRIETGDPEQILMAEVQKNPYDLVAIGALGSKRSRRIFLDTVGMRIIEMAQSSVLVIKGNRPSLSRVLICASGTEHGHMSVWAGAAVACGAGAQATVLHVIDAMPSMYTGLEQMEETLEELLQSDTESSRQLKWAAQVVKAECGFSELKLRRGIAAEEILREAQIGDHDLIVLGSSRYAGGLVRALMGDLTRIIVSRAKRPVLVVRPMDKG